MKSFLPAASFLWVGVALSLAPPTLTYSRGASRTSCQKMSPGHIRAHPQEPEHSHVALRTSASSYLPGQFITVTVRSSRDFMGFLLQARTVGGVKGEVGGGGGVVLGGSWALTPPGTHTLRCVSADDTLTHSDKQLKRNLSFVWRAPDQPAGDVQFYITVVQSYFVYWAGIESAVVHDETRGTLSSRNTTVPPGGDAVSELQEEELTAPPALKAQTALTRQMGIVSNSLTPASGPLTTNSMDVLDVLRQVLNTGSEPDSYPAAPPPTGNGSDSVNPPIGQPLTLTGQTGTETDSNSASRPRMEYYPNKQTGLKLPKALSEVEPASLSFTTQTGGEADGYTTSAPPTDVSGQSANETRTSALLSSHLLDNDEGGEMKAFPPNSSQQIWTPPPTLMPSPAQLLPLTEEEEEQTVSEPPEPFTESEPKNPTSSPTAVTIMPPPGAHSGRTQTTKTAATLHRNKTMPAQTWTESSPIQLLELLTNRVLNFRRHLDPSLTQTQIPTHSSGRQTAASISRLCVDSSRLQLNTGSSPTPANTNLQHINTAPPRVWTGQTRTRSSARVLLSPAKTQSSQSLSTQINLVWIQKTQPHSVGGVSEVQNRAGLLQTIQAEPEPKAQTCTSPPPFTSQKPNPFSFPYTENDIKAFHRKDPIRAQIPESPEAPPPFATSSSHPSPTSPLPPTFPPFLRFKPSSVLSIHSSSTPSSSSIPLVSPSPISIPPLSPTLPPLSVPTSQTPLSSSSYTSLSYSSTSPSPSFSSDALPRSSSPLSSPSPSYNISLLSSSSSIVSHSSSSPHPPSSSPHPPSSSPPPSSPTSSSDLSFFSSVSLSVTSPHPQPSPAPRRSQSYPLSTSSSTRMPSPRLTPGQRSLILEVLLNSPHPIPSSDAEHDDLFHLPKPGANLQPDADRRLNQRPPKTNPSVFHPRPGFPTPPGRPEISPGHGAWRERTLLLGGSAGLGVALVAGMRFVYRKACCKRTAVSLNDGGSEYGREERGGVIRVQECGDLVRVRRIRDNSFVLLAEYDILTPPGN